VVKLEMLLISVQLDGMEELKFGILISKLDVHLSIMMRISTVLAFLLMENTLLLLEEERVLRFGMLLI
jgi:hypothetical protein